MNGFETVAPSFQTAKLTNHLADVGVVAAPEVDDAALATVAAELAHDPAVVATAADADSATVADAESAMVAAVAEVVNHDGDEAPGAVVPHAVAAVDSGVAAVVAGSAATGSPVVAVVVAAGSTDFQSVFAGPIAVPSLPSQMDLHTNIHSSITKLSMEGYIRLELL